MKQKAIAYFRTSGETGSQNKGFGLATQKKDVADYCKKNGIEIVKTYISDGVSGAELEKDDQLIRMLEEMNGEDLIISKSSCRLYGRDMTGYRGIIVKRHLMKAGKKVVFTDNPSYDLFEKDPSQMFMNQFYELMDAYERLQISTRLNKSRRSKVRGGSKGSGRNPLGYEWSFRGKDKVMIVNPKTKPVVEFLFKNYDPIMKEGTFAALSRRVAKEFDIPNKLTPSGIRRILLNKYYIGKVIHGDMEVDGDHETFISKNRFNKVGRLIRRNVG
jgi:site-specific DNA recombinase